VDCIQEKSWGEMTGGSSTSISGKEETEMQIPHTNTFQHFSGKKLELEGRERRRI
jgi:hypothetical protein